MKKKKDETIVLIEKAIKQTHGSKGAFCDVQGHKPKDFASKLKTLIKKIRWINDFLAPLGLKVEVK